MDDPSQDGWNTELFNNHAGKQLAKLGEILKQPKQIDAADFKGLLTSDFYCSALVPESMETLFDDETLQAARWNRDADLAKNVTKRFVGACKYT